MVKFDEDDFVFDTQQYPSIAYNSYLKFRCEILNPFEIIYPGVKNIITAKYLPLFYFLLLLDRRFNVFWQLYITLLDFFSSHWKGKGA